MGILVQFQRMEVLKKGSLIPVPKNMSFGVWVAKVIEIYPELQIPIVRDEKEWEKWVNFLFLNPEFSVIPHTNLKQYQNWREWAEFFISTLT